MPKQLHQEPTGIATRARSFFQRLFWGLDAGFESDQILNVLRQLFVELDKERDCRLLLARDAAEVAIEARSQRIGPEIRRQLLALPAFVLEREGIRVRLEKEI